MASRARAVIENVPGKVFVDATCIDCDTCRQVAPLIFGEGEGHSFVRLQPQDPSGLRAAARATLCCPTASIGVDDPELLRATLADFPLLIDGPVHHCGFHAESSFGATSYLILRPDGNWLVDTPRWMPPLAERIAAMGGISDIFLTHQDDVADAARWARHFSARRWIHAGDAAAHPEAEAIWSGEAERELAPGMLAIPTPGHTAGSACLLVDGTWLFTGDHCWWSRHRQMLWASQSYCWWDWAAQRRSLARLLAHRPRWLLPGHGERLSASPEDMHAALTALVAAIPDDE